MLPRKSLIPLRSELSRIRKDGKIYDSASFGLVVSFGRGNNPRCAFIVSKKVDRRSVVRHQVRRKLADAVAPLLSGVPESFELVFLAKSKAVSSSLEQVSNEIKQIFRRAKIGNF